MADFTIGSPAIDASSDFLSAYTVVDLDTPATGYGTIHTVEVWAKSDMTGFKVGVFYLVGSVMYCRSAALVNGGIVTAGAKRTFTGLSIEVETGDYIGFYCATGKIERDYDAGGVAIKWGGGDLCTEGASFTPNSTSNNSISLQATASPKPVVTTQDATDVGDEQATGNGTISGGTTILERGFEWGTVSGVYPSSSTELGTYGDGAYTFVMPMLTPGTVYYFRAKARNSIGWGYGSEMYFTSTTTEHNWETIQPSGDSSINQLEATGLHYAKVIDGSISTKVSDTVAIYKCDMYYLHNTGYRGTAIKKIRLFQLNKRSSPSGQTAFGIYTNGGPYYSSYGILTNEKWHSYTYKLNPATGVEFTLTEIDNLLAGVCHYDSGLPSGVGTAEFLVNIIWKDALAATLPVSSYTGTTAKLNGRIVNSEGSFITKYGYGCSSVQIQVRFNWGTTTSYGTNTSWQAVDSGDFHADITGLTAGARYHYRTEIQVRDGNQNLESFYGADVSFPAIYPSWELSRVTALRHIYRPGSYRGEVTLGDVSTSVQLAQRYVQIPTVKPAETDETKDKDTGETEQPSGTVREIVLPDLMKAIQDWISTDRITRAWEEKRKVVDLNAVPFWQRITPWNEAKGETFKSVYQGLLKSITPITTGFLTDISETISSWSSFFKGLFRR